MSEGTFSHGEAHFTIVKLTVKNLVDFTVNTGNWLPAPLP